MWELYPDARELILVRDPRDMLASILAFNRRRGFDAFGREDVGTDQEYVHRIRGDLVRLRDHWKQNFPSCCSKTKAAEM